MQNGLTTFRLCWSRDSSSGMMLRLPPGRRTYQKPSRTRSVVAPSGSVPSQASTVVSIWGLPTMSASDDLYRDCLRRLVHDLRSTLGAVRMAAELLSDSGESDIHSILQRQA